MATSFDKYMAEKTGDPEFAKHYNKEHEELAALYHAMQNEAPQEQKVLCISSSYLSQDTLDYLDACNKDRPVLVPFYVFKTFQGTNHIDDYYMWFDNGEYWEFDIPRDLRSVFDFAALKGYEYLRISPFYKTYDSLDRALGLKKEDKDA
jgi:hypothetical protein